MRDLCWLMAMLVTGGAWATAAETVLIRGGEARCTIVVPDRANETVRHAAEELAGYLRKISGAGVSTVEESRFVRGVRIDVGMTRKSKAAIPQEIKDHPEGLFVGCGPEGVILCGGSARGTVYAVYTFLERTLGCRWLAPGGHEYVPSRKTVLVRHGTYQSTPKFDLRTFISGGDADRMTWGLKMGLNGFYTAQAAPKNGGAYYLPAEIPGCHTWYRVIPGKRYFDAHPDWFPLIDGKRTPGRVHGSQLCVTAKGLADAFAQNIIAIFDRDPACKITSISPNDGYGWCECEQCEALDRRLCGARTTQQGLAKARRFRGDRVFWFVNEVARRVAKKHPDKKLLVLAYVNYAEPPDTVRPLPNVVPWLCHYAPADYARSIADPASGPNRQFNELLRAWAKVAPHLLFYSYVSKSMWWELPRPVTRSFAADVKYLASLGIHRYYAQSRLSNWALDGPLYYVLAKLLWDPDRDPDALAADWIRHMFGSAAPQMTAYYRAVEDSVRKSGKPYSDNPPRDVPGLYILKDLDRAKEALTRAAEAATDDVVKDRVAQVTRTFLYGDAMVRAIGEVDRFKHDGDVTALQRSIAFGKKALEIQRVPEAARFLDSIGTSSDLGVPARGFGKAEERDGRKCWNSDETGRGDGRAGWASFFIDVIDPTHPAAIEMDVWGTSELRSIVIRTNLNMWNRIDPAAPLSGEPKWETLRYRIPPALLASGKRLQELGFGGRDSQIWVAGIRAVPTPKPR